MEKKNSGIYWIIYSLNTICLFLYNKNHKTCLISIFHSCFSSFHHFGVFIFSIPHHNSCLDNSHAGFFMSFSQVFPQSFLRPHPCRASFYHHFPVLTLDSLPCPSSFAIRNPVETFQLINQLNARAGERGCLMVGFGDHGQGCRFPCCVAAGWEAERISRSFSVSWALNPCSVGLLERSRGRAAVLAQLAQWLSLELVWTLWWCMRGLRLWRWFLFSSAYKWNFWCGTGWECDSHHCRESKGKKRKGLLFFYMFDKNWGVNLLFRVSKMNSLKKVKVSTQGISVLWLCFFIFWKSTCKASWFSGNLFTSVAVHRSRVASVEAQTAACSFSY